MEKWIITFILVLSSHTQAATYYIAASGSDADNGTSKSTPWQHTPGMTGCTGNCASITPRPGDRFILKGGDTWHIAASGQIPVGIPWTWSPGPSYGWNGTAGNPIYVGIDTTWHTGTVWSRPKLNGDNPLSTSPVAGCLYPGGDFLRNNASYVTFEGLEFLGICSSGPDGAGYSTMNYNTDHSKFLNFYYHGWTFVSHGQRVEAIRGATSGPNFPRTNNEFAYIVIDGSDSPPRSFTGLYGDCYNFHHNIFRNVCNAVVCNNGHLMHDNLFEYVNETVEAADHGNVFELNAESNEENYFYNNVIRHIGSIAAIGVNVWIAPQEGTYVYNNAIYDINVSGNNYFNNTVGAGPAHFYNNTFQRTVSGYMIERATSASNNHWITDGSVFIYPPSSTENDLTQTNAAANSGGYTGANGYAPTSEGAATVRTGSNQTGLCASLPGLCQETTFGVRYDEVHHRVAGPGRIPQSRPTSGAWDGGAYQYTIDRIADYRLHTAANPALPLVVPNPIKAALFFQYRQARPEFAVYDLAGNSIETNRLSRPGIYMVKAKAGGALQRIMVVP